MEGLFLAASVFVGIVALIGSASVLLRLVHAVTHRPQWAFTVIALLCAALITQAFRAESRRGNGDVAAKSWGSNWQRARAVDVRKDRTHAL